MDFRISFGDLLQIATTIGAITIGYTRLVERLVRLETKVEALWERRDRERG